MKVNFLEITDNHLRIFRVALMQLVSLATAAIFSVNLSPEVYSNYLLQLLYFNFPMVFIPSLFLSTNKFDGLVYNFKMFFLPIVLLLALLILMISDLFVSFDSLLRGVVFFMCVYFSNENTILARRNCTIFQYTIISLLILLAPFMASLSSIFEIKNNHLALIDLQIMAMIVALLLQTSYLAVLKKIKFDFELDIDKGKNLVRGVFPTSIFTFISNANGYIFQLILRKTFVELSILNDTNLYNFALGIIQRIHMVYDAIGEKYFHQNNQRTPDAFLKIDVLISGVLLTLLAAVSIANFYMLVIFILTATIYFLQAFSSKFHHFMLGKRGFSVLSKIYLFSLLSLVLIYYNDMNIMSTLIAVMFVNVLMYLLFSIFCSKNVK